MKVQYIPFDNTRQKEVDDCRGLHKDREFQIVGVDRKEAYMFNEVIIRFKVKTTDSKKKPPATVEYKMAMTTLFELSFFSDKAELDVFFMRVANQLKPLILDPSVQVADAVDPQSAFTLVNMFSKAYQDTLSDLYMTFSDRKVLIEKANFISKRYYNNRVWGSMPEMKMKREEQKKEKLDERFNQKKAKDDKMKERKFTNELSKNLKDFLYHHSDKRNIVDTLDEEPTSQELSRCFPLKADDIPDCSSDPQFSKLIIEYAPPCSLNDLESIFTTTGNIFESQGHLRKYCIFPGEIVLVDKKYPAYDLTRRTFAEKFQFSGASQNVAQDIDNLPKDLEEDLRKQILDHQQLSKAPLPTMQSDQKEKYKPMIRKQDRAFGIMMNQLLDFPAFLDRPFTSIIMALMAQRGDFTTYYKELFNNYLDLTLYNIFDNDLQFYEFDEQYSVFLKTQQIYARDPSSPDSQSPVHLLKKVINICKEDDTNKLPFVIALNRKDKKGKSTVFAVIKPWTKYSRNGKRKVDDYLTVMDCNQVTDLSYTDILTKRQFSDLRCMDYIFASLSRHVPKGNDTKEGQAVFMLFGGVPYAGVSPAEFDWKDSPYYESAILYRLKPCMPDSAKQNVSHNVIVQLFEYFSCFLRTSLRFTSDILSYMRYRENVKLDERHTLDKIASGIMIAQSNPDLLKKYKTSLQFIAEQGYNQICEGQNQGEIVAEILNYNLRSHSILHKDGGIDLVSHNHGGIPLIIKFMNYDLLAKEMIIKSVRQRLRKLEEQLQQNPDDSSLKYQHQALTIKTEGVISYTHILSALRIVLSSIQAFMTNQKLSQKEMQVGFDASPKLIKGKQIKSAEAFAKQASLFKLIEEHAEIVPDGQHGISNAVSSIADNRLQDAINEVFEVEPAVIEGVNILVEFKGVMTIQFNTAGLSKRSSLITLIENTMKVQSDQGIKELNMTFLDNEATKTVEVAKDEQQQKYIRFDENTGTPIINSGKLTAKSHKYNIVAITESQAKYLYLTQGLVYIPLREVQGPRGQIKNIDSEILSKFYDPLQRANYLSSINDRAVFRGKKVHQSYCDDLEQRMMGISIEQASENQHNQNPSVSGISADIINNDGVDGGAGGPEQAAVQDLPQKGKKDILNLDSPKIKEMFMQKCAQWKRHQQMIQVTPQRQSSAQEDVAITKEVVDRAYSNFQYQRNPYYPVPQNHQVPEGFVGHSYYVEGGRYYQRPNMSHQYQNPYSGVTSTNLQHYQHSYSGPPTQDRDIGTGETNEEWQEMDQQQIVQYRQEQRQGGEGEETFAEYSQSMNQERPQGQRFFPNQFGQQGRPSPLQKYIQVDSGYVDLKGALPRKRPCINQNTDVGTPGSLPVQQKMLSQQQLQVAAQTGYIEFMGQKITPSGLGFSKDFQKTGSAFKGNQQADGQTIGGLDTNVQTTEQSQRDQRFGKDTNTLQGSFTKKTFKEDSIQKDGWPMAQSDNQQKKRIQKLLEKKGSKSNEEIRKIPFQKELESGEIDESSQQALSVSDTNAKGNKPGAKQGHAPPKEQPVQPKPVPQEDAGVPPSSGVNNQMLVQDDSDFEICDQVQFEAAASASGVRMMTQESKEARKKKIQDMKAPEKSMEELIASQRGLTVSEYRKRLRPDGSIKTEEELRKLEELKKRGA